MKKIKYRTTDELKLLSLQNIRKSQFDSIGRDKLFLLDSHFHGLHKDIFSKFSCLDCANCCKTISPIITNKDIDRISKCLGLDNSDFISKYLHVDEDNDFVFNQAPCPFLKSDNYCSIYSHRPKACCEYPHTDRSKIYQIVDITLKNCEICPVVYKIVDEIKNNTLLR